MLLRWFLVLALAGWGWSAGTAEARATPGGGGTALPSLGEIPAPVLQGGKVSLAWDPNPEAELAGYLLHYGTKPGVYPVTLDVGNVTNATIELPVPGQTYYVAVTAYGKDGSASQPSNEVSSQVPLGDNVITRQALVFEIVEDRDLSVTWDGALPVRDGQWLIAEAPAHGELTTFSDVMTYTPTPDFYGDDSFRYLLAQVPHLLLEVVVTVKVLPQPDLPYAFNGDFTVVSGRSLFFELEAEDVDGDPVTFRIQRSPLHGKLTGKPPFVTYVPEAGFIGTDEVWFLANDGTQDSLTGVIALRVIPENLAPVVESLATNLLENTLIELVLPGQDPEGKPVTFAVISAPEHGVIAGNLPKVVYTPDFGFQGGDFFRYAVSDPEGLTTVATVTLSVVGTNHPPSVYAQDFSAIQGQPEPIHLEASDADGDPLTFRVVNPPQHGELTGTPPNLVYRSDPDFVGRDTFTFRVSDGKTETESVETVILVGASPVPAPTLVATRLDATRLELRWDTTPGFAYQVWRTPSLTEGSWQAVGDAELAGQGSSMSKVIELSSSAGAWFFEVVARTTPPQ